MVQNPTDQDCQLKGKVKGLPYVPLDAFNVFPIYWQFAVPEKIKDHLAQSTAQILGIKYTGNIAEYRDHLENALFYSDAAKSMWEWWNEHYDVTRDANLCINSILMSWQHHLIVVEVRKGIAESSKGKSKGDDDISKIISASKKLRSLLENKPYIHCVQETGDGKYDVERLEEFCAHYSLQKSLSELESFLLKATYGLDMNRDSRGFSDCIAEVIETSQKYNNTEIILIRLLSSMFLKIVKLEKNSVLYEFISRICLCLYKESSSTAKDVERYILP